MIKLVTVTLGGGRSDICWQSAANANEYWPPQSHKGMQAAFVGPVLVSTTAFADQPDCLLSVVSPFGRAGPGYLLQKDLALWQGSSIWAFVSVW